MRAFYQSYRSRLLTARSGAVTMAMTSFQGTNLAVAGGNCGLSMWDLVEEKRLFHYEPETPASRPTAICQVRRF